MGPALVALATQGLAGSGFATMGLPAGIRTTAKAISPAVPTTAIELTNIVLAPKD